MLFVLGVAIDSIGRVKWDDDDSVIEYKFLTKPVFVPLTYGMQHFF